MKAPAIPADDAYRVDALRSLPLLDTPPEPDFDAVVRLGKSIFNVPICLISLVDQERQWFKACIGLPPGQTSRAVSFCGHAILQEAVFIVPDATKDERFFDNPFVTAAPFVRFYAGAPIKLPSGYTIGTVCLIDSQPREFNQTDTLKLEALAALTLNAITLRALRSELDSAASAAGRYQAALQAMPTPFALTSEDGRLDEWNDKFQALCSGRADTGVSIAEALGLPVDLASDEPETTIVLPTSGMRLRIFRDANGFLVTSG